MSDQEARFREHLAELRKAARGLGGDVSVELKSVEKDIEKLPHLVERDAKRLEEDIEYDLLLAAVKISKALKATPHQMARGARAVGRDAVKLGKFTKRKVVATKKNVKKDVKSGFARAAGVKTAPISEWKRKSDKE